MGKGDNPVKKCFLTSEEANEFAEKNLYGWNWKIVPIEEDAENPKRYAIRCIDLFGNVSPGYLRKDGYVY